MSEQFNHNDPEFMRFMQKFSHGKMRFAAIDGVHYPIQKREKGMNPSTGKPYTKIPSWGIETADAAKLLHSSCSSARAVLHRHNVGYRKVSGKSGSPRIYWRRSQVEAIAARRGNIVKQCPARMVDSETAIQMLGIGRSTLYRYVHRGMLKEKQMRLMTARGTRNKSYYLRSEVAKLAAKMRAIHARFDEINAELAKFRQSKNDHEN